MKTLIIDNYDSFTFNLFQMIAEVNAEEPIVVANDQATWEELAKLHVDNIVLSPGPGRPENDRDFGVCMSALLEARVPVLGVCLGHEGIGHAYGAHIVHAPEVMHGRTSPVYHDSSPLFDGIPQGFNVVRYHSLMVADGMPEPLEKIAWTDDGVIMALRHRLRPIWGVQFHPESICTEFGSRLLTNFRDITARIQGDSNGNGRVVFSRFAPRPWVRRAPEFEIRSRKLPQWHDPENTFVGLYASAPDSFWLDSSRAEEGMARFSFMGAADGPLAATVTYELDGRRLTIAEGGVVQTRNQSILEYLGRELERRRCHADELPFDFNCGFVGYLGYELKAECGARAAYSSPYPDAAMIFADRMIAFDHHESAVWLVSLVPNGGAEWAETWFDETQAALDRLAPAAPVARPETAPPVVFHLADDHDTYLRNINACLAEIDEGETYEVCLTNRITAAVDVDPLAAYRTLRSVNPAPYAAFLRFGEISVLCSSPERFLLIDRQGWVESKPIKGTRPRAATPEENEAIREELRTATKDRAENLMIVDLLRNDLGRVCDVGSVHVPKLMHVESYATVHQLVSTIRGRLRGELDAIDCIRAAFPGGSMTGAPKLRTMEIIDRLEGRARGVYSGTIGFLAANGSADLNIVIRTLVLTPGRATMGVGGAIVALSDPEEEFEETLLKARAQVRALVTAVHGEPNEMNHAIEGLAAIGPERRITR